MSMWRTMCIGGMAVSMAVAALAGEQGQPPSHDRPYFMTDQRRQEILALIKQARWAQDEYDRVKAEAAKGNGYWAAFIYALEGDRQYLEIAQKWLLNQCGRDARETLLQRRLMDDGMFNGPEGGHMGPIWYGLEIDMYAAFDWVCKDLPPDVRDSIHYGLRTRAEYRMEALDHWTTTPNLVLKPITMVAFAGLTVQDDDIMNWGFNRTERQGNYLSMVDRMLTDGGVWHEAPIYAVYHKSLWCMATMAFYRQLYDGKDWFTLKTPAGGSPRGLMDYFIDSSYPIERTGVGHGRVRIATFGDGSTSPLGDTFLAQLRDELAVSHAATGDPGYAAFLAMFDDYKPNLWDHGGCGVGTQPDAAPRFPAAPCRVWPTFGVAMLRSDESPEYWTNPNAIAVQHIMTKRYGHDQPDKFHISLFGAGRLLYPDFLAMQYEHRGMGWTYTSSSHSTMQVDEHDTGTAEPVVRQEFTPEVKVLATSAEGVFDGVSQTRALLLTREYLLDVFHASSKVPRLYDYVLHSMGAPQPLRPKDFKPVDVFSPRYWALDNPRVTTTSRDWRLEFMVKDQPPEKPDPQFGPEWYEHEAKVRVTMAAEPGTQVCYGTWGDGRYRQRVKTFFPGDSQQRLERWKMTSPPRLGMLIARRPGIRVTTFASTHEPFANEAQPQITAITKLAETDDAIVVRIDAEQFTDYAAVAFGPDADSPLHVLVDSDNSRQMFSFRNYAYVRVPREGAVVARGGWTGFRVAAGKAKDRSLLINGQEQAPVASGRYVAFGDVPEKVQPAPPADPECPFAIDTIPQVVRLSRSREQDVRLSVTSAVRGDASGWLEFDLPAGLTIKPKQPAFGPIRKGDKIEIPVTFTATTDCPEGRRILPVRVRYRHAKDKAETTTQYVATSAMIGIAVEPDDRQPGNTHLAINTPFYSADADMFNGCIMRLSDPDGRAVLDRSPLFTIADENGKPVASPETFAENVWFAGRSMTPLCSSHYIVLFEEDRMIVPRWRSRQQIRLKEARFTIPGAWTAPGGAPRWKRIIAVDEQGREFDASPGQDVPIAAAELEFPQSPWSLAFQFMPPRKVSIDGTKMQFAIKPLDEMMSIGFCPTGGLDEWRKK
ncbi:MAG TPA: hypothetical protein VM487_22085 [Phycisphaerae bacterium]|nr:hypothetical protein [Phycisphaerae bacterium]